MDSQGFIEIYTWFIHVLYMVYTWFIWIYRISMDTGVLVDIPSGNLRQPLKIAIEIVDLPSYLEDLDIELGDFPVRKLEAFTKQ